MLACGATDAQAADAPLTGHAALLYRQAQGGHRFADAEKLHPAIRPTSDQQSFLVVWKPAAKPARWIVSLHGTQGFATDDLAIWASHVRGCDIGLVCVQWWLRAGNAPSSYYTPDGATSRSLLRAPAEWKWNTLRRPRWCAVISVRIR